MLGFCLNTMTYHFSFLIGLSKSIWGLINHQYMSCSSVLAAAESMKDQYIFIAPKAIIISGTVLLLILSSIEIFKMPLN